MAPHYDHDNKRSRATRARTLRDASSSSQRGKGPKRVVKVGMFPRREKDMRKPTHKLALLQMLKERRRFQGNSFEGPIPPSFSNLTKLVSLIISDLSNGNTSLEFLKDMTSLNTLILRNNKIYGPIPSKIGDYQSLSLLLGGDMDTYYENLYLNKMIGTDVDVSYNELSGSLPSWIDEQGLQLNLVANNFTIENANDRIELSSKQLSLLLQFSNLLGLENGNYTVTLQFAEIEIANPPSWQSLGRRVFDVYIQGLGLENGNYTMTLQFAKIEIADPPSWQSLGRRVFDVYIQDIHKQGFTELAELQGMDARPYTFSYAELKAATEDFNPANKLGEGGFGPVFKGTLNDGRVIAAKQLSMASHHGKSQFVAEIATISIVQHRNLVKLYGCCIEGDKRLLVYEYLENKILDEALFVARGLAYLHEESRLHIVHRDVKASNILLDFDLNPKISDFDLAKLYDDKKTHISTRVEGTIGYLAPEYAMRGHLIEKADVYDFGVVALEMVSGRPNCDSSLEEEKIYLLEWAWRLHENDHDIELVDANLMEFDEEEVKRVMGVALLCTHTSPQLRPLMLRVVAMLLGDTEVGPVTARPGYLTDWKLDETTTFMTADTQVKYSQFSSSSVTMGADPGHSPINAAHQVEEVIGECSLLVFQEISSD
ncbi:hypothetical protein RHMOL_Rhmol06G0204800 [Rhododendron molle]|uniref:Uncharacterized protein n=1 Tax=Rhododendron molle TaxID=49168 RepID=A0ACC0NEB0_RHOML|nr:hypothetical protein RHMOL_Rhmol06G0204800 [Rhododendron molle]